MRRFLTLSMALALYAGAATATVGDSGPAMQPADSAAAAIEMKKSASYGCCWIYIWGRWYCVPCS